jgi:hypothetical protein
VLGYTLPQVRGFLHAIRRQEAERDARLLSLGALAARGDARQIEKTLDRLLAA